MLGSTCRSSSRDDIRIATQVDWGCFCVWSNGSKCFTSRYSHRYESESELFACLVQRVGVLYESLLVLSRKSIRIGVVPVFGVAHRSALRVVTRIVRAAALENPSCFCARSVASERFTRRCSSCCASESGLFRMLV